MSTETICKDCGFTVKVNQAGRIGIHLIKATGAWCMGSGKKPRKSSPKTP